MIEVSNLCKSFGSVPAVNGVSFTASDGQITGLLGPNGAGKTTTLRMLYTGLAPDQGSVTIDGIDACRHTLAARRRLGVLPDANGLYRNLTARENIEYFARLQGLAPERIAQRTAYIMHELGIGGFADRVTDGFSQGQRLKTAIARALVHEPHNIVLDEPTNGLDVMSILALRNLLGKLRAQGRCILLSSHVMHEVTQLCDRIVIIAGGRVVADGSPDELKRQTGRQQFEDAFVDLIRQSGTSLEGIAA